MFIIIGGDGKEYGPVSAAQVRSWVAAGRANLDTQAKVVGSEEWRTLGDYAEFSAPAEAPPIIGSAVADPALAERWRRLLGALADGMLETICWTPTSMAMMHAMAAMVGDGGFHPEEFMTAFWAAVPRSLPYLAALVLVQATLLMLRSQSVGNLLTRTRIVRVDNGEPGGFLRAFLLRGCLARVFRHIPLLGGLFWIVDNCFIFRADKRCVHDLIAGTKVVKV